MRVPGICSALLLSGLIVASVAHSADEPEKRSGASLDEVVAGVQGAHDVPALGGAIVELDGATAIGVAGVRAHGSDARVTRDDLWHLGSCTKAMTATLVARLVEAETLSWTTPLSKLVPVKRMHSGYREQTLVELLGNRAGLPGSLDAGGLWQRLWRHDGTGREARALMCREVLRSEPAVEPGSGYLYSNAGFSVAGHAAEVATDEEFPALLTTHVFEPLGMETAGFGAPGSTDTLDQPRGHRTGPDGELVALPPTRSADNPPAITPAGRVHASLEDWARFVAAHLDAGASEQGRGFLSPASFKRLHRPLEGQDYALGWTVTRRAWAGGRVLTHSGSNTHWYCVAWLAPDRDFAVLATCNRGGDPARAACDALAGALIQHHLAE